MKSYETEPGKEDIAIGETTEGPQGSVTGEPQVRADEDALVEMAAPASEHDVEVESEDIEDEEEATPARRFVPPSREQILNWLPFWLVILLAAILRFWGLGDKPLHHDESLHAYFSLQLMHQMENWIGCFSPSVSCYHYDPLLHGPFQFHAIATVYKVSQLLGAPDNGVNTTTVRIAAATLGTLIVALPYFLRDYLGKPGAWLACFLLAVSPSMVYFSRFAREDIYMACFTMLLVVAAARYVRDRKMKWLVLASLGFALSYATKEATFLTIAVFGSFIAGLVAWEIGLVIPFRKRFHVDQEQAFYIPRTAAPITLLVYLVVVGIAAKFFFGWLKQLSIYVSDPRNTATSNAFVQTLKDRTVAIVPWLGILLGVYVLSILWREAFGKLPPPGRHGLAARINPTKQRFLDVILTMPWTHWFFAILAGWTVFILLFTVLFTNIRGGIGDGIWQGLYYWIQQQQVARGGQPWYYYLLLIPLYEQIGVVFGLAGVVRCLVQPTRFRLFLVYWFVGNVFIYSWAGEKMPWLMIHMTMPMMLLGAIALEPVVMTAFKFIKGMLAHKAATTGPQQQNENTDENELPNWKPRAGRVGVLSGVWAIVGVIFAFLLLLPTLHNMYEVTYIHAADGPHEMMVYVQTTTDVNVVMSKVDAIDKNLYGGQHKLPIVLLNDATWPFAWYVRDYSNVCFDSNGSCFVNTKTPPVIITGNDNLGTTISTYSGKYLYHQYHMRTWWDEGYKPPPCVVTKTNNCDGQQTYGGVGPLLWLSYGDTPPPHATFNLGLAVQHIWQWWWDRKAIGDTSGSYDMGLFIRGDVANQTGVQP